MDWVWDFLRHLNIVFRFDPEFIKLWPILLWSIFLMTNGRFERTIGNIKKFKIGPSGVEAENHLAQQVILAQEIEQDKKEIDVLLGREKPEPQTSETPKIPQPAVETFTKNLPERPESPKSTIRVGEEIIRRVDEIQKRNFDRIFDSLSPGQLYMLSVLEFATVTEAGAKSIYEQFCKKVGHEPKSNAAMVQISSLALLGLVSESKGMYTLSADGREFLQTIVKKRFQADP